MVKKALACTMFLGVVVSLPAAAAELIFKGGIGVIPVSSGVAVAPTPPTALVVESVNRNIVRNVQPAGQIWVIDHLDATVSANGRIKVDGKGLILGGGNSAGRAPDGTSVFATLICEPPHPLPKGFRPLQAFCWHPMVTSRLMMCSRRCRRTFASAQCS